ncbi:hypothetical protein [Pseudomonas mucidolens]|uniref:hypothetical protein n=1 Tax=Pseudomonas mucidolens TaxID=46679 RepID=UPI0030D93089
MKTAKEKTGAKSRTAGEPAKVTIGAHEPLVVGISTDFERASAAGVFDENGWDVPGATVRWTVSTSDSAYPVTVRESGPLTCIVSGSGGPAEGHVYTVRLTATSSTHPHLSGQGEYEVRTLDIGGPDPEIKIEPASPPHGSTYNMYDSLTLKVKMTGIPAEEGSDYQVRYTSSTGPSYGTGTVFPDYPVSTTANPRQPGEVTVGAVLMRNGSEVTRTNITYTVVGEPKDSSATPKKQQK